MKELFLKLETTLSARQKKSFARVQVRTVEGSAIRLSDLFKGLTPVEFKAACDNLSRFFSILKEWDEKEKAIG